MSWGNDWNSINFDTEAGLSLLYGKNGHGKSAISNLVIYMLYGQLDGFTQTDIPNRINKHFEGEIFLEANNQNVYIYRALAPNDFKVTIDDKQLDMAGKQNIQKQLEEEIYKINYSIFKNSIVLSVNNFKSFIDLTPKEKRDIIDRIFGYSIINKAYGKIKDKQKEVNTNIIQCENIIDNYNTTLNEISKNINDISLKFDVKEDFEYLISEIKTEIQKLTENYKECATVTETQKAKLDSFKSEYNNILSQKRITDSKLNLYSNKICPMCGAPLDDEKHKNLKNSLITEKETLDNNVTEILTKTKEQSKIYETSSEEKTTLVNKINEEKIKYATLKTKQQEQEKAKTTQIQNLESMKNSIETKLNPQKEELSKLNKISNILNIVNDIFSETGLKQYISNIYVPLINNYVSDTCDKLGIFYKVNFTTGYDCEIKFMGEIINYKTLSTGERKKIDVAVTLAFLKIIKTKISDINILFLDEVLSSIDVESCNELIKIFSDFSKDVGLRIYMVHHANLDSSYVDNVIAVEKQNGFSHFI